MSENCLISVIVPCYNQEKYIKDCLDSVLAQTFTDYEVIAIDDGSTDSSVAILNEYAKKDDRIRVIIQSNQGVVAARNNAIKEAKGKYILPLDADDKIHPTCLEKLYKAMCENKGDIITSRVQYFGLKSGEYLFREPNKLNMSRDNCLPNASIFKKTDFEKIGGYDIAFARGLEDYDLWLNMMFNLNLKVYRIDEILLLYCAKDESQSRNLQQRKHTRELRKIMLKKYPAMRYYRYLYSFLHFFIDYKVKEDRRYIKILGVSLQINKKKTGAEYE